MKKVGMKAVMKKKRPRFTPHHRKERSDFAIRHQHWTLEDWKKSGQMKPKSIAWVQMAGNGCGKGQERV